MDKIDELFNRGFNLEEERIFFPIRHHSPVCSYHLIKTIEMYKPTKILIEGPRESEELIPFIISKDTTPPISIYYSFFDKNKEVSEEGEKYYCYYPFLSFSPEYVALKEGERLGIKTSFIDLSYGERIVLEKKELREKIIGSDKNISYSSYVERLCEIQGCRDFNELWERTFEVNGLYKDTKSFVKELYAFCYFARESTEKREMEREGTLLREEYMAECIRKEKGERVLIITGGFHTKGILEFLESKAKKEFRKKINSTSYIMPYSLKECNSLFGYSSGMPYIGFYSELLSKLIKSREGVYRERVLDLIIKASRELRKEKVWISTPDEVECFKLSEGLSLLRNKREPGVYELLDGIRATFIKGEIGYGTIKFFDCIDKLLIGEGIGVVCNEAEIPPLVKDFREKIKEYRLKVEDYTFKEKVLDIYKNPRHLEIYEFFNATIFLNLDFCEIIKGPDLINRRNLNLIRVTLKYKWAVTAERRLIELSVNGGTIKEACTNIILDRVRECRTTLEYSNNLIWCYNLGLLKELEKILPYMEEIIIQDEEFLSLVSGLNNISYLINLLGEEETSLKELLSLSLNRCYLKVCTLIPNLGKIKEEGEEQYINALLDVFNFKNKSGEEGLLIIQLKELSINCENEGLLGGVYGLLYGAREENEENIIKVISVSSEFSRFLKGLIFTAKDLIFRNNGLIGVLNERIKNMKHDDFLNVLPHLRFGFKLLTPLEIATLGGKINKLINFKGDVIYTKGICEKELNKIEEIERETLKRLKERWNFIE